MHNIQCIEYNEKVEKRVEIAELRLTTTTTIQQEEEQMLTRIMEDAEIEESLAEMDLKRKAEEQTSQEGRKPKKRRMERLEG